MRNSRLKRRGFSLVELLIVVVIMLAVAAIAMPRFVTYVATYRLRGAMADASGLLQQMRMEAVRRNTVLQVSTSTQDNGRRVAWVNLPGGTSNWDAGEPFLEFPKNIDVQNTGYPGDATTAMGYTAQTPSSAVIRFNQRGLPCVYPSGNPVCENIDGSGTQVGFVLYFRNSGSFGSTGWGALTITPAGRIRTWLWNGASYSGQ